MDNKNGFQPHQKEVGKARCDDADAEEDVEAARRHRLVADEALDDGDDHQQRCHRAQHHLDVPPLRKQNP